MKGSFPTLSIDASSLRPAVLTPPLSKSDAIRALVLSRIVGRNRSQLWGEGEDLPSDVRVVQAGLDALDAASTGEVDIDCRDGGAPFRLLLTQAATTPGARVRFTGTRRLWERPHQALFGALLESLGPSGLRLVHDGGWPLRLVAPTSTGEPHFRLDAHESSQHASSLLLGACALSCREGRPWTVELTGELPSEGYFEMTVRWAARCGFRVDAERRAVVVRGFEEPARWPEVPGDWSSIGYLLLLSWASGGTVRRVDLEALHPDRAAVRILEEAGLSVGLAGPGEVRVSGRPVRGVRANGEECPDLLPTLAAFACVCPSPSELTAVHVLTRKESDRLEAIVRLVAAAGGRTRLDGERLVIEPPARVGPFRFSSSGDHRMAMSAATLAAMARVALELEDPDCVAKSFPGFFAELERVGARLVREG